jgi:hypothetical protein
MLLRHTRRTTAASAADVVARLEARVKEAYEQAYAELIALGDWDGEPLPAPSTLRAEA